MRKGIRIVFVSLLLAITVGASPAAQRHWIGNGTGIGRFWGTAANWSATQGGAGGAGVPTAADDVYIDGGGRTEVNVNAVCLSFTQSHAGHLTDFRTNTSLTVGAGGFLLTDGTFNTDVSNTVNVAGNFTVTGGSFLPGTGTINLNGSASQALNTNAAFYNLTLNNAAGFTLASSVSVNNTLTLTSGIVQTGANTLIIPASGTVARTTGHVSGNLRKNVATGATTVAFEVGGAASYAPVSLTFGNVTTAGDLTASSADGDHPSILSSTIHPALGVNRYWTLTNGGVVFTNYSGTFNFTAGDLDPGTNTGTFVVDRYAAGSWSPPAIGGRTATSTQATGLTAFGDFAVGNSTVTYTITASASAGGSITPSGSIGVDYGNNQSFAIAPNTGYHIDSVVVDGANQGAVTGYDFTNVTAGHTIAAYFSVDVFTITASASAGGSISPSGSVNIAYGGNQSFAIVPDPNHHIDSVVVDGTNQGAVANYDFTSVAAGHSIAAYFSIDVMTITASASPGGTITPSGAVGVNYGSNQSFAIAPNTGYHIDSVVVDGANQGAAANYDFTGVTAGHAIAAYFSIDTFTIAATASAGGSISPSGSVDIVYGGNQSFAITPDPNHHIDSVVVDGANQGAAANYDFTGVTADHAIAAYFSIDVFTIAATASAGGTITPSGSADVAYGNDQSYSIAPGAGYHIDSVLVDGVNQGTLTGYSFTNVSANHTISAWFSVNLYTIAAGGTAGGTVAPSGAVQVAHGSDQVFSISPSTGYYIADVFVDTVSAGATGSYSFTNVTENHSIFAVFAIQTFSVAASAGPNGSISPTGVSSVDYGDSAAYTITPGTGYFIADVRVDSVSVGPVSSWTFNNVTANHLIEASFAIQTFQITGVAGPNGAISPAGVTTAGYGDTVVYTVTPNTGYYIADVHVDSVSVGPVGTYAFNGVTAGHLIEASFALIQDTITATATAGGSISPAGAVVVGYGADQSFTVAPNAGYHLDSVLVDGVNLGVVPGHDFTNVTANHTIAAYFSIDMYTIAASAGPGGTIAPSGSVQVAHGSAQPFTIAPATGYFIADVHVDSVSVGPVAAYTFTNVTANHLIEATFAIRTFQITAVAGPNGAIAPAGVTTADYGDTVAYTITPAAGYFVSDVHVDSVSVGPVGTYAFNAVTANHLIEASFSLMQYTINATASGGGTISPSGAVGAGHGDTRSFTMTPNAGYHLDSVRVDGVNVGAAASYDFVDIQASHAIAAYFSINMYTIAASAGSGGSITPSGAVSVAYGASQSFMITPATGYYIADVHVDTVSAGATGSFTFTNVTSNHAIHATFAVQTFTVTALAGPNGSVSPAGATAVEYGDTLTIAVTPDSGWFVQDVKVDSVSVGAVASYTFNGIAANHLLEASFGTNAVPSAFALVSPPDNDTLAEGSLGAVAFTWRASSDADAGDTLSYTLRITGPGVDYTVGAILDTTITIGLGGVLTASNSYAWTVSVSDGRATVASQDTFGFFVSPATGVDDEAAIPKSFALGQNYPNPFNPSTEIPFDLPERSAVTLTVFNVLGVEVMQLAADEEMSAGFYRKSVDFSGLPTGAYFYRLSARGESGVVFERVMKLVVLR